MREQEKGLYAHRGQSHTNNNNICRLTMRRKWKWKEEIRENSGADQQLIFPGCARETTLPAGYKGKTGQKQYRSIGPVSNNKKWPGPNPQMTWLSEFRSSDIFNNLGHPTTTTNNNIKTSGREYNAECSAPFSFFPGAPKIIR
jgi:hypothetical protein